MTKETEFGLIEVQIVQVRPKNEWVVSYGGGYFLLQYQLRTFINGKRMKTEAEYGFDEFGVKCKIIKSETFPYDRNAKRKWGARHLAKRIIRHYIEDQQKANFKEKLIETVTL